MSIAYWQSELNADRCSYGHSLARLTQGSPLFDANSHSESLPVWMSHGDQVSKLPDDFTLLAKGDSTPVMAMANEAKKLYGLQFHPEVTHTKGGILRHRN